MDNASATPIDISVQKDMTQSERELYANPNGIHTTSVKARACIDGARAKIARALNAHTDEIIFTGSGTESDALAIIGTINKYSEIGLANIPHIVTTTIEHSAVIENCKILERKGLAEVTYVAPEANGIIDPKKVEENLRENTILVSVMYANNEIGTVQPIQEIAKIIRRFRKQKQTETPFLHTDACQAMNYLFTENIEKLGVDLMTFNGSKIYGPKGSGVLYKKRSVILSPIYGGGGQENGLRSGTEDVSRIVGVSKALEITNKIKGSEVKRLEILRDYFFTQIPNLEKSAGCKIHINGDRESRLPNNINISIDDISSELLVIELDANGIAVSSRSACKSTEEESSHVIHALRVAGDEFNSEESLRITLGRETKIKDIKKLLKVIESILLKYKNWK
ncbi:MAG: Cysteine desulfurase [Patescibacteria group bacterium]|nr:Cysteine desulfurase [Patescibacteria group bacterium]